MEHEPGESLCELSFSVLHKDFLQRPPVHVPGAAPGAGIPPRPISARISSSAHTALRCCSCPGSSFPPPNGGRSALLCAAVFAVVSSLPPSTCLCWECTFPGLAAARRSSSPGMRISVPSGSCALSAVRSPANFFAPFCTLFILPKTSLLNDLQNGETA